MKVKRAPGVARSHRGFTLIEMVVVLAIIAVLTGIVAPNMFNFTGTGKQGAMDKEKSSVQTSMKAMLSSNGITAVTAQANPNVATNAWNALPAGPGTETLDGYLETSPTVYFYCWDSSGNITHQDVSATACP